MPTIEEKNRKKGFTLIELLVAMSIMAILTIIGLGSYRGARIKARDSVRKGDLSQIQRALEIYFNDRGTYPSASGGMIVGCGSDPASPSACSWGATWSLGPSGSEIIYIKTMPSSPGTQYCYQRSGKGYQLYARLENAKDPNCLVSGCALVRTCNGVQQYNYGVSSQEVNP